MTKNVGPDQTAPSDLGLQCLLSPSTKNFYGNYRLGTVKYCSQNYPKVLLCSNMLK